MAQKPFFVTISHAGEKVPSEVTWLENLPETVLMCDVDRYVDLLYQPALDFLNIPSVVTPWHRYVVDLNRLPSDLDALSVQGAEDPENSRFKKGIGLHWARTTKGDTLISEPMSEALHLTLVELYYRPFHEQVESAYKTFFDQGHRRVLQIDAHSMPSQGTEAHPDPGEKRSEIVVSDLKGKSCDSDFTDIVITAFRDMAGFEVAYNWPYVGGRVTERYGMPGDGQNAIQVELNRALYMNETTKKLEEVKASQVKMQIQKALSYIHENL